jgi:hypothetical protein
MVQVGPNRWELIAPNGTVLVDDIAAYTDYEAECWAKAYVSSYNDWEYEILPLEEK